MWKTAAMPDRMGSPDKLTIVTSSKGSSFAKDSNVNFWICKGETVTEQRWTSREVTNKLAIYCKERRNQQHTSLPSPCCTTGWALSRSVGSCDHLASNRSSWDQNIVIFPFVPFVSLALCRRKYFNISQYFTLCCPIIEMIASLTWELAWTGLIEWELNIKNWPEFDPPILLNSLVCSKFVFVLLNQAKLLTLYPRVYVGDVFC